MLKFPHQFPIALENAVKSIILREPGKLVPILSPKYGYFFPSDSHPMVFPTPWKMHGFSHQYPIASIPDTLELKAKYIKRRRGHGCYFIKKRGIQIYIRQKYTTLHKTSLTFNNQLQKLQLLPKNFNEKRSNRGIWQESVLRIIILKKIVNSIHTFLLLCDVVIILLNKLLSFTRWYCHIEFVDIVILNCHYYRW